MQVTQQQQQNVLLLVLLLLMLLVCGCLQSDCNIKCTERTALQMASNNTSMLLPQQTVKHQLQHMTFHMPFRMQCSFLPSPA
jgi:hypothetical protein